MAYTGTNVKDLDITKPDGASEYGNILDDAIIEVKTVFKNTQSITTATDNITLDATHSFVILNKATAISATLPTASDIASATFTKEYRIKNIGAGTGTVTGTVTLNGTATVNPTLAQYDEIYIWTDGTTYYGMLFAEAATANTVVMRDSSGYVLGSAIGLGMTDEASASADGSTVTLDLGTVTAGDRIFVSAGAHLSLSSAAATNFGTVEIGKSSGTATIAFFDDYAKIYGSITNSSSANFTNVAGMPAISGVLKVTGSGTLVINAVATAEGFSATKTVQIYAFFLKKQ